MEQVIDWGEENAAAVALVSRDCRQRALLSVTSSVRLLCRINRAEPRTGKAKRLGVVIALATVV